MNLDPAQIDALARVFAEAAVDRLVGNLEKCPQRHCESQLRAAGVQAHDNGKTRQRR